MALPGPVGFLSPGLSLGRLSLPWFRGRAPTNASQILPTAPSSRPGKDRDLGTLTGAWLSAPDAVKDCRGRVLVHCQAGISRSATICLAYLMMKKRVRLEEAFEFVKQRRSIISPNFSFMGQLLQFESQVLATSCSVEAASPSGPLRERGKATPTPTSQFVFSFPVSVGVHPAPSSLPYLHSPITTSPSC